MSNTIPIYLLAGMTPYYPVYSRLLPLLPEATVVPFIEPRPYETLVAYAERMAPRFPTPCFIGGTSFGGILAQEISRIVEPAGCIVIASIRRPAELPPRYRIWRFLGIRYSSFALSTIGRSAAWVPSRLRSPSTMRLTMLAGKDGAWHRWATSAVLGWSPGEPLDVPVLQIHGEDDTTFPIRYTQPDNVVLQGRHALPISHPAETATAIVNFIHEHAV